MKDETLSPSPRSRDSVESLVERVHHGMEVSAVLPLEELAQCDSAFSPARNGLELIRSIAGLIANAVTLEELLDCCCEKIKEALGLDAAALLLADESFVSAEVKAIWPENHGDGSRTIPDWPGIVKAANAQADRYDACMGELSTAIFGQSFQSLTFLPLSTSAPDKKRLPAILQTSAAIALASKHEGEFGPAFKELLAAIGGVVSLALERMLFTHPKERELERRSEELENFVYVISHNLKTPIVSIQGFANLLQEELGPHLGKEHLHFLERIQKNAALMERMILDLLDFSKLGRNPTKFEWVSLQDVTRNLIAEMQLLERASESPSEFGLPKQVSQAEFVFENRLPCIMADGNGMKIVFENLLSNAMKYRRAEVPLRIEIGSQDLPRFHAFWVKDNGIGMDPAFQNRAFNLFQRGPNTTQIPGTGVGLAIVRRIIENHKGLIRLDSKPGEGTTVYFTIPKTEGSANT